MIAGDNTNTTLFNYIGPSQPDHGEYVAVQIRFAEDFDISTLPKSVRAYPCMSINFTPKEGNAKNETGLKRLRRIMKALEGRNVEVVKRYANSLTEEEFFARYA